MAGNCGTKRMWKVLCVMTEPILLVMAAGIGSRYGGLKQIDPIGEHGEIIIDYSLYDAYQAGFRRVIFLIKREMEEEFKKTIGNRASLLWDVEYVFQEMDDLPAGFTPLPDRKKPWGTGHAVWSCRKVIDAPFCVINADDFYGTDAFRQMYSWLTTAQNAVVGKPYQFSMVGYILENTLTENGHVARGVCRVENGKLANVTERIHVESKNNCTMYTEDDGQTWTMIPAGSTVSMNFWGFTTEIIPELERGLTAFLKQLDENGNSMTGEFFLPTVVNNLVAQGGAAVEVFRTVDRWYGVTYRKDKPVVRDAIRRLCAAGKYPQWLRNDFN